MGINLGAALSGFQAGIDPIIKTRLQERAQRNLMQLEQQHKLEAGEVEARQRLEQAQALQRETLDFQRAENKADRDLQEEIAGVRASGAGRRPTEGETKRRLMAGRV